ncbi:uncharacterized protein LOC130994229 [Salvia miltiorrhiza]|uniref:uncharacterized protein LOC130994229 n=1 Tax=Salvia miltiorrhiza TaxID=226208 RepID=UPI0025AC6B57|nr:uncharacterized protein LOC130994229 [Salvia miltiorrhiza]
MWCALLNWFGLDEGLSCYGIHELLVFAWTLQLSSQIKKFWKLGVISLIWALWTARNKCHFDDKTFIHQEILVFLKATFIEVDNSFPKMGHMDNKWKDYLVIWQMGVRPRVRPPPEMTSVYWSPPAYLWLKANSDGSAMEAPGRIYAGGVFRDWRGFVRGCFHVEGGLGFAFEAELLRVISAIQLAHRWGWNKLWFEADSSYVVHILSTKSTRVPWRFKAIWNQALLLLERIDYRISHIFREGNVPADIMASPHTPEGWWPFGVDLICDAVVRDLSVHSHVRCKF